MTYEELDTAVYDAWQAFFSQLAFTTGLDTSDVADALDGKNCFNDVFDAIISCVEIDDEEE